MLQTDFSIVLSGSTPLPSPPPISMTRSAIKRFLYCPCVFYPSPYFNDSMGMLQSDYSIVLSCSTPSPYFNDSVCYKADLSIVLMCLTPSLLSFEWIGLSQRAISLLFLAYSTPTPSPKNPILSTAKKKMNWIGRLPSLRPHMDLYVFT